VIRETIVTSCAPDGAVHIAPMGVRESEGRVILAPFRPSTTLDNVLATGCATVNLSDDVRVFAGCLTGRRNWPTLPCVRTPGVRLNGALAHRELKLASVEDDAQRPRLYMDWCTRRRIVHFGDSIAPRRAVTRVCDSGEPAAHAACGKNRRRA
jgi:hypothetical protein